MWGIYGQFLPVYLLVRIMYIMLNKVNTHHYSQTRPIHDMDGSYQSGACSQKSTELLCTLPKRMLQPIAISMYWHPKNSHDPANVWLRAQLLNAAGLQP